MWIGAFLAVLATFVLGAQTLDRKGARSLQSQPAQD
jgi:hypothetical protein